MSARFCKGDIELAIIDLNEGVKEVGDSGALDAVCQGEVSFIDSFYTEVVSVLGGVEQIQSIVVFEEICARLAIRNLYGVAPFILL